MSLVSTYLAIQFLKILTLPYDKTEAFKAGVIDDEGVVVGNTKHKSYGPLERIAYNLKKLLNKLPSGVRKLGSIASAMWLLKEHVSTEEYRLIEDHMISEILPIAMNEQSEESMILKAGDYVANTSVPGVINLGDSVIVEKDCKPIGAAYEQCLYQVKLKDGTTTVLAQSVLDEEIPTNNMGSGNIATAPKPLSMRKKKKEAK